MKAANNETEAQTSQVTTLPMSLHRSYGVEYRYSWSSAVSPTRQDEPSATVSIKMTSTHFIMRSLLVAISHHCKIANYHSVLSELGFGLAHFL